MAATVAAFEQAVNLITVTKSIVAGDFKNPVESIASQESIRAVIQVANPENLNVSEIDFSLRYVRIHTRVNLSINQYISYAGTTYRIVTEQNWSDYGYFECIGEEWHGTFE